MPNYKLQVAILFALAIVPHSWAKHVYPVICLVTISASTLVVKQGALKALHSVCVGSIPTVLAFQNDRL